MELRNGGLYFATQSSRRVVLNIGDLMPEEGKSRRLSAIFKNAVAWGVTWGALGTVVTAVMRFSHKIPLFNALIDGIGMGVRIGIVGALTGAAFASFISIAYRHKRLSEISTPRFGIGGAILAGLFVPAWMQTMNLLTGGSMVPWNLVTDDIVLSAVFGGITAAGTMFLAKRGAAITPEPSQDILDTAQVQSLGVGEAARYETTDRSRLTQRG